jgi:hypothetical protein
VAAYYRLRESRVCHQLGRWKPLYERSALSLGSPDQSDSKHDERQDQQDLSFIG